MTTKTGSVPTISSGDTTTIPTNLATYRDFLKALSEAWTTYTPTWASSGTQPVLNNGTLTGRYMRADKYCAFRIDLHAGTTTTVGTGTYTFALPTGIHATGEQVVAGDLYDGANHYACTGIIAAGASVVSPFSTKGGASGSQVQLTGGSAFAAGTLAVVVCQGVIELA